MICIIKIDTNTNKNFIVINTGKGGSKSRSSNIKSNEIYDKVKELNGKDYYNVVSIVQCLARSHQLYTKL